MIKVNLAGESRKKVAKPAPAKVVKVGESNPTSILLLVMFLATGLGGYWWWNSLTTQSTDLSAKIDQANQEKASLETIIKQDQVYEARKKALENRIRVIENLQRNQVSPVQAVDVLADAIDRTEYVWLSSLDQNNTLLTMSATASSLDAIADFVTNLGVTGYFRDINLVNANAQNDQGYFTFALNCQFAPRRPEAPQTSGTPAPGGGGN
jgi:Tfp pilus assembly protein PilN